MTVTEAPSRSLQQRLDALRVANDIRIRRARLKEDIGEGRQSPVEVLVRPPDFTSTMKVFDFLTAIPKIGRVKANKFLSRTQTSASKTLGGISDRQRRELSVLLQRDLDRREASARQRPPV